MGLENEFGALALDDTLKGVLQVDSVPKKWRSDFGLEASFLSKWDIAQIGAPPAVPNVAGGTLVISTGTNPGDETSLTSKQTFTIPCRCAVGLSVSQRIANQQFRVEFVSCDPDTGAVYPVGDPNYHQVGWLIDATTTTQGKYEVTNSGILLASAGVTITSPATTQVFEVIAENDACRFSQRTIDSTVARLNPFRRDQNLPDPNLTYKLRVRATNLGVAPASNTNLTLSYAVVVDYNEIVVEISAGQGNTEAATALPVNIATSTIIGVASQPTGSLSLGVPNSTTTALLLLMTKINSAAGTNSTLISSSTTGRILGWSLANNSAAWRYFKLYTKTTAPVIGTDTPTMVIAIPPGGKSEVMLGYGLAMTTGIGYGITAGALDTDTTAIGANEVVGSIYRC